MRRRQQTHTTHCRGLRYSLCGIDEKWPRLTRVRARRQVAADGADWAGSAPAVAALLAKEQELGAAMLAARPDEVPHAARCFHSIIFLSQRFYLFLSPR